VLLLAVHWLRVDDVMKEAGDLSGRVIVTCALPMNAEDTALAISNTSSGAETLAEKIPKAQIVSAFGTVPSEVFFDVFEAKGKANHPSLAYCGDHTEAKKIAATLIGDVGFEPIDVGPLRIARYLEPLGLLMGQIAYEGERGPEVAYRFEWMGKDDVPLRNR
jgi:hypothetical protein